LAGELAGATDESPPRQAAAKQPSRRGDASVVGAFGTPLLAGLAGPVTQFVLNQLKHRA